MFATDRSSEVIESTMKRTLKGKLRTKLMLGIAIGAVLAGGTTAVVMAAQPGAHRHRGGALATAAGYLGLSTTQLKSELASGKSLAQIANATSGKSSPGLIAVLEASGKERLAAAAANLPARVTAAVNRVGGPRSSARRLRSGGRMLAGAASYLGVSAAQLREELRAGKTLAQVAKETSGKSEAGLIEALVTVRKAALASAVKGGLITQARADSAVQTLSRRIATLVNRVHHARGAVRGTF